MLSAEDREIDHDEILYRAVKHGLGRIHQNDGSLKMSTECFLDPSFEVSVDRAKLCNFDPAHTQVENTDYIFHLLARNVRAIKTVTRNDHNGNPIFTHGVDVRADPLGWRSLIRGRCEQQLNLAHAVIYADPQLLPGKDRKLFSRLKEALAQIAVWEEGFSPSEEN